MRGNAKDYLYQQIASAITMRQEAEQLPNYWCPLEKTQQYVDKLNWMLTESIGVPVKILIDAPLPNQTYQIQVEDEIVTVQAEFCLITTNGESDPACLLHDVLTSNFPRITPNNLEGFDEVYQEFIDGWREHRRNTALRNAGF